MTSGQIGALLRADARSVSRDPLLPWMLLLPIGIALLLRLLIPAAHQALLDSVGLDLEPFYPLIMGGYLMTAPGLVGMVVGFLILDERDARTLTALRVTPLSMRRYLAYRTLLPLVLGTVAALIGYPLVGVAPLPVADLIAISAVAAFAAPILALVLAIAAPNKVAGFAVMKVANAINLLPIGAYFLPLPAQLAAGLIPTYWPMRALWSAAQGDPYAAYLGAGTLANTLALLISVIMLERTLLRRT